MFFFHQFIYLFFTFALFMLFLDGLEHFSESGELSMWNLLSQARSFDADKRPCFNPKHFTVWLLSKKGGGGVKNFQQTKSSQFVVDSAFAVPAFLQSHGWRSHRQTRLNWRGWRSQQ